MNLNTNECTMYGNPDEIPLNLSMDELSLLMYRFELLTLGEITEEEIRLYVELRRTFAEAVKALKDQAEIHDPWGELR